LCKKKPVTITEAYHNLITAVIKNAIADLGGLEPDKAMAFILSDGCEAYCAECGLDYYRLRRKAAAVYSRYCRRIGE
jgi:hypothetical protein